MNDRKEILWRLGNLYEHISYKFDYHRISYRGFIGMELLGE